MLCVRGVFDWLCYIMVLVVDENSTLIKSDARIVVCPCLCDSSFLIVLIC